MAAVTGDTPTGGVPVPDIGPTADIERRLAEWRGVAQGPRTAGIALAGFGVVGAILRATVLPRLPQIVPVLLIVLALGLLGIGIVRRLRYHQRHRKERQR